MHATVTPEGSLEILSRAEVNRLRDSGEGGLYHVFRKCSLAVLNYGATEDDSAKVLERHREFDISIIEQDRGIQLTLRNAPPSAFVDGKMIRGIRELLFAVLRDIVYISNEVLDGGFELADSGGITNAVFHVLRNARVVRKQRDPKLVVCWGGHAIGREEYQYTKDVGYELGLRGLNIGTGCGPGAMKGPMKGATIAHAKQRIQRGRYVGITAPGIIAAEPPNPIVNELVIMPDMEKRLEAFVRVGHGIVVFPGGVGTAEEILYLLGVLLHPKNEAMPFPLVFTGPRESRDHFQMIDDFVRRTLGEPARQRYTIIIDDAETVAREMLEGIGRVKAFRRARNDAYYFNWLLHIEQQFQTPFSSTHESMLGLELHRDQPVHDLAANLRRAFSGIVAANVQEDGIRAVREHGPFEIRGEDEITRALAQLLDAFVQQRRMKLSQQHYAPTYRVIN